MPSAPHRRAMAADPPTGAVDPGQVESELKFRAADGAALRRLARVRLLGPARLGPAAAVDELDRYLDTTDRRLASVGWACRLRTRGERWIVSLKGPPVAADAALDTLAHGPASGMHRRIEVEGPATARIEPAAWPPSAARDRLAELAGSEALLEVLVLRQRRVERTLDGRGGRMGTLSLDTVAVLRAGRSVGRLWVVEAELTPAASADAAFVEALRAALARLPGLVPDPMSKLEHAQALLTASSAPDAGRS